MKSCQIALSCAIWLCMRIRSLISCWMKRVTEAVKMCKYCEIDDTKLMNGKTFSILGTKYPCALHIRDHSKRLIVEFGDVEIFSREVNYCPMCGRKL